ncbi:hypothetical protein MMC24_007251 [Lignoscripta atroalba]|nr:hypothetical protein [Lignoscripta atroalba]
MAAARVILADNPVSKGEAVRDSIQSRTFHKDVRDVVNLDMDDFQSVKEFTDRKTLQVNTLSTALLGLLMLPKLRASRQTSSTAAYGNLLHLVIISSGWHELSKRSELPTMDNILEGVNAEFRGPFHGQHQYGLSKVLVMFAMKQLAALSTSPTGGPSVFVTACCPGASSQVWPEHTVAATEEGAWTVVWAADLGPAAQGPEPLATSTEVQELQKQTWAEIIDALKEKVPEVASLAASPA